MGIEEQIALLEVRASKLKEPVEWMSHERELLALARQSVEDLRASLNQVDKRFTELEALGCEK